MVQDSLGCRLVWIGELGAQTTVQGFPDRWTMKRESPTLHNRKGGGVIVEVTPAKPKLSPTMQSAVDHARANGGKLCRYPGGAWMRPGLTGRAVEIGAIIPGEVWFSTQTIQSLIARRAVVVSGWAHTSWDSGKFPTEVTVEPIA